MVHTTSACSFTVPQCRGARAAEPSQSSDQSHRRGRCVRPAQSYFTGDVSLSRFIFYVSSIPHSVSFITSGVCCARRPEPRGHTLTPPPHRASLRAGPGPCRGCPHAATRQHSTTAPGWHTVLKHSGGQDTCLALFSPESGAFTRAQLNASTSNSVPKMELKSQTSHTSVNGRFTITSLK